MGDISIFEYIRELREIETSQNQRFMREPYYNLRRQEFDIDISRAIEQEFNKGDFNDEQKDLARFYLYRNYREAMTEAHRQLELAGNCTFSSMQHGDYVTKALTLAEKALKNIDLASRISNSSGFTRIITYTEARKRVRNIISQSFESADEHTRLVYSLNLN